MQTVDEYLAHVTPSQLATFKHVRKLVRQIVPDAAEKVSYGVPAFMHKGKPLLYFAAYKQHMSIYPASDSMVEAIGEELGKFRVSKGTFRFTEEKPIPDVLITKVIKYRLNQMLS